MTPTPTPTAAILAECRELGATWVRYYGPHWALRDTPIWELYRDNGGQMQRRLLGYDGGEWRQFDEAMPMDVQRVDGEVTK